MRSHLTDLSRCCLCFAVGLACRFASPSGTRAGHCVHQRRGHVGKRSAGCHGGTPRAPRTSAHAQHPSMPWSDTWSDLRRPGLMCANVTPLPSCVAAACRSANDAHVEARVYGVAALSLPRPHAHAWREKEKEGQEEIVIRFINPHRELLTHQSESESPDPYPDRPSRAAVAALPA